MPWENEDLQKLGQAWKYLQDQLQGEERFRFEHVDHERIDVHIFTDHHVGFTLLCSDSFDTWKTEIDESFKAIRE